MVKRSRRDDLHNTKTQMKLFTAIATAVVLGGSLIATANPASAQYYGGYQNHTINGPGGSSLRMNQNGMFRNYQYNDGRGGSSRMTCSTMGQLTNCY